MKNIFKTVQGKKPNSNTFDLSHDKKLSCNPGQLIPILMEEAVPGDVWNVKSSVMVRFAPMIAPIMHQVNAYIHYFFVPNRLLWDNWENFITGGEDGQDESVYPTVDIANADSAIDANDGTLIDYLGYPTADSGFISYTASAMPFQAYNLIFDEYYRDQNMVEERFTKLVDGDNTPNAGSGIDYDTYNVVAVRAWQHDYFTAALPFLQKGPEATLPLGASAPINRIDDQETDLVFGGNVNPPIVNDTPMWEKGNLGTQPVLGDVDTDDDGFMISGNNQNGISPDVTQNHQARLSNWFADLGAATASSINDLRRAFKLQEWLEKNARGGSRYTEIIRSHFGVKSSDARLQRPEYFGGVKVNIQISEVLQTTPPNEIFPTPQGNMAGHAIGYGAGKNARKYCEEHGWIVGILSIMPKTAYQDGLPKKYFKFDKFDHYWPEFAHIGEQEIKNKEVHVGHNEPDGTFGYIPRYSEYKFINSSVHGDFKNQLDFWHWGRKLSPTVSLNEQFISCVPDRRIFAVMMDPDLHVLWTHVYNSVKVKRLMPYFGNPKI